jgi:myo-inositol-1(or 4)-monophosphatase
MSVVTHLDRELETAGALALAAGELLRRRQAGPLAVEHKAHGEIVTTADTDADALIQAGLRASFPTDVIFSEESPDSGERYAHDRVWIVDPLDSTSSFVRGGDEYAVSIGLSVDGEAFLGAIYVPAREQLFAGSRARGVTLNGEPVHVSDVAALRSARVTVSPKELDRVPAPLSAAHAVVPIASMAHKLARVAAGLDDGAISLKDRKEWGTCAGVALVIAAGGSVTLRDGGAITFNRVALRLPGGLVAAGSALLHRTLVGLLRVPSVVT